MTKKATIIISLVKESEEKSNQEIEKEIIQALTKQPAKIPWMKSVEKVEVTD